MQLAEIEQLARNCFARLCPWIAKEYPEFPVEKSTTMQAFIEGAKLNGMWLDVKAYSYKHTSNRYFFLTLNGKQIGNVHFSMREIEESMMRLKRGDVWDW